MTIIMDSSLIDAVRPVRTDINYTFLHAFYNLPLRSGKYIYIKVEFSTKPWPLGNIVKKKYVSVKDGGLLSLGSEGS